MNKVAIIGGGPAGLMCAITAKRLNGNLDIIIFEKNDIASTLLATGGGRCNLSNNEFDIKTFVQNYPRGEKFLYSIFNRFFVDDTIEFFNSIGINTYIQDDKRIFPESNKSLDVIFALKNEIKRLNINVIYKEITNIFPKDDKYIIDGEIFDKVVIAIGGKNIPLLNNIEKLGHNIIEQKPALSSLEVEEKYLANISGVSLKNISAIAKTNNKSIKLSDDLLFTHKGISGPLVYKISSIFAKENYSNDNPIEISLDFINHEDFDLQRYFDKNPHKEIVNLISEFIPKSLARLLLDNADIDINKNCCKINKLEREVIKRFLASFTIHATNSISGGEIVSCGGVDLREIDSKTMMSKISDNLFFCGEVVDIDGFCGGFNLQSCWSTGFVAGSSLL